MEIKTKFDVGQTVYEKEKCNPMTVQKIKITEGYSCPEYYCRNCLIGGGWFDEDILTAEKPKQKSVFDLKDDDIHYVVYHDGRIDDRWKVDNDAIMNGSIFTSREDAVKEVKRRRIHQELKKLANGYKFTPGNPNYSIYYEGCEVIEIHRWVTNFYPNTVYFSSYEDADNAIHEIGEDRIKQDYFNTDDLHEN